MREFDKSFIRFLTCLTEEDTNIEKPHGQGLISEEKATHPLNEQTNRPLHSHLISLKEKITTAVTDYVVHSGIETKLLLGSSVLAKALGILSIGHAFVEPSPYSAVEILGGATVIAFSGLADFAIAVNMEDRRIAQRISPSGI